MTLKDDLAQARALLLAMDLVYGKDEDTPNGEQVLDMNDVWGWGTAWGEAVPDDALLDVARLVRRYGRCGVYYWVSEQHGKMRSEFEDINRMVEFVRHEEQIIREEPNSSRRAYLKRSYTV